MTGEYVTLETIAQKIKVFERRNPSAVIALTGKMTTGDEPPVKASAGPTQDRTVTLTLPLAALQDAEFLRVVQRYLMSVSPSRI